ncbi:hypothetical protein ACO0LO_04855 [Undibacterium sp. TJN25]|uniref:hypothetical protein n=1 Tax=Undibacterium sp. TJN25 TaxID=3413056 RepID=UPI003BF1D250
MRNEQESDRFGVPLSNLLAAEKWCRAYDKKPCHVPTRKEVASLSAAKITAMLVTWMCDCPTEIIPSRAQIAEVKAVLQKRADSEKLSALITMCNNYISGD